MPTILAEKEQIKIKTFNYKIRNVMFEGKEHIVVPVIMMTEGVHCGSGGAVYHSIEELGHFPEAWNGIPVCIFHPKEGDSFISANSPEVIESQTVGRIFNTHVDGTKLKAECWIDVSKITEISPLAYQYIIEMRPLEVSVGVFTDDEQVDGVWNGEEYHLVAHNHRPDHLALLPGGQGACSWADGAGIRANENIKKGDENLIDNKQKRIEAFLTVFANEGFVERLNKLQDKINMFDGMGVWHFVEEVFEEEGIALEECSTEVELDSPIEDVFELILLLLKELFGKKSQLVITKVNKNNNAVIIRLFTALSSTLAIPLYSIYGYIINDSLCEENVNDVSYVLFGITFDS